jgi:hypothetical protein
LEIEFEWQVLKLKGSPSLSLLLTLNAKSTNFFIDIRDENDTRYSFVLIYRPERAYYYSLDNGKHNSRDLRYYSHNLNELHHSRERWKVTGINDLWFKIIAGPIQEYLFIRWKVELLPENDPNFMKSKRASP